MKLYFFQQRKLYTVIFCQKIFQNKYNKNTQLKNYEHKTHDKLLGTNFITLGAILHHIRFIFLKKQSG